MKKIWWLVSILVLATALGTVGAYFICRDGASVAPVEKKPPRTESVAVPVPPAEAAAPTNGTEEVSEPVAAADGPAFTPAEQQTFDAIQDALDDNDLARVTAQAASVASATNAALRAKAVEALRWFGAEALEALTPFLADADDAVRETATDAWTAALSQLEADDAKARMIRLGMGVITDRGQLEMLVAQVDDLTDFQKLDILTQVIEGSNPTAAEVARARYRFWTEEDYTDRAAAQKWLDDRANP